MQSFEDTDSRPYDRHRYRVVFQDDSFKDVGSYAEATDLWYRSNRKAKVIDVLPASKAKNKAARGGFG